MTPFRIIVYGQLVAVGVLLLHIASVLGADAPTVATPLYRDAMSVNASSTLEYYFENKPGQPHELIAPPTWMDPNLSVDITEDTLKETREYAVPKPEGVFRIVMIGDSWTYGMYVSTRDIFSERMERALAEPGVCSQPVEVINLGVPGYDLEYITERFRLHGIRYEPDLVIYLPFENDFLDWNERYYQLRQSIDNADPDLSTDDVDNLALVRLAEEAGAGVTLRHQLGKLDELGRMIKSPMAIFTFEYLQLRRSHLRGIDFFAEARPETHVFNSNLRMVRSDTLVDHHPNPEGHRKIAEMMLAQLDEANLIPCDLGE